MVKPKNSAKEPTLEIKDIKTIQKIDFDSSMNKSAFDKIEKENAEIIQSARVSQETLKLRFEI